MKHPHIIEAMQAYREGRNISERLRELLGVETNTPEIIEIAYDLQAGSYIESFAGPDAPYYRQIGEILAPLAAGARTILDVGTGECTTLYSMSRHAFSADQQLYGCDISWSRLRAARTWLDRQDAALSSRVKLAVGDMMALPFQDKSIDVVWTSHALEPNGGREREALREIFRVARKTVCLFEPSYEDNSGEGRARMDKHGYIRGLPEAIADCGGVLREKIRLPSPTVALNPTYAFVIELPATEPAEAGASPFACPNTGDALAEKDGFMACAAAGLVYPILKGIPVLRADAAILATSFDRFD